MGIILRHINRKNASIAMARIQCGTRKLASQTTGRDNTPSPENGVPIGWKESHEAAPQGGAEVSADAKTRMTWRQRRAIYRSKQRGLLELDIVLGQWAARHVPEISNDTELKKLETLLDEDSPDLLGWIMRKGHPPPHVDSELLNSVQTFSVGGTDIRQS